MSYTIDPILIQEYNYTLPPENIAQIAIEPRDASNLLIYENETIKDDVFKNIHLHLPPNSQLFFNDAKVIPARIFAKNKHEAGIEIFLLKPYSADYFTTLNATQTCQWECLIGNKKKWKIEDELEVSIRIDNIVTALKIKWIDRDASIIELYWKNPSIRFLDLLDKIGQMPLPPYIKRQANGNDSSHYQTIYSATAGSVAAPTAGLHFTESVLENIRQKNIPMQRLTLHVSAGTFLPVNTDYAHEHPMHEEIFSIELSSLKALQNSSYAVAVGTTSVRVLESIYWCGFGLFNNKPDPFIVSKMDPYENKNAPISALESLQILIDYMSINNLTTLNGATSIMIMPGYDFKFVKGLITNFHQPKSTLLLLIAAFTKQKWKNIYDHALEKNYRFLSYGDSSLLLR